MMALDVLCRINFSRDYNLKRISLTHSGVKKISLRPLR